VLDDCFGRSGARSRASSRREALDQEVAPLEKKIEVAIRGRRHTANAVERAKRFRDFLRDGAGRLAQPSRQLERHGGAQIAEFAVGRVLERDRWW
jgi:hypothetical protein